MGDQNRWHPDFINSFLPVFRQLKINGIYFFDENTRWWNSKHPGLCVLVLYCVFSTFHIGGVVRKFSEEKALSKISVQLGGVVVFVEGITTLIHLIWSRKSIKDYILKLDANWPNSSSLQQDERTNGNKITKKFDKFINVYFALLNVNMTSYIMSPMARNVWNAIVNGHFTRELPFYIEMWFDFQDNVPMFIFIYLLDAWMLYIVCWMVAAPLWLITATIYKLYLMFETFHFEIRHLFNQQDHAIMQTDIQALLNKHTTLLQLQDELSRPFGAIFAIHVGYLVVIIGFYAITAMVEKDPSSIKEVATCVIGFINILPICYFGQLLTDSSIAVAMAAYNTDWHTVDIKYQKILLLVMHRAQKPKYIMSTFLLNISLTTYTKVVKATWSFLSLILTMIKRQ